MNDAMGEDLYDALSVLGIFVMEVGVHAAHQVSASGFQVVQGVLGRLQFHLIGNVQLLEDEFQ